MDAEYTLIDVIKVFAQLGVTIVILTLIIKSAWVGGNVPSWQASLGGVVAGYWVK